MKSSLPQSPKWNAADYAVNSAVQQSWAREIIAQLNLRGEEHILDGGCGDGKITAEIAKAVSRGLVVGIDASSEMIAFAQKTFPPEKNSNLIFQVCDARKISDATITSAKPFDLVFSNAALHWVDDHEKVLCGAASVLKSGGRLMISCGGKGNAHDVFLALSPVMRLKRWREFFREIPRPYFFYAPDDYEKWLPKCGFKINALKLAPKDSTHVGTNGFAGWLRTTWFPYTQCVPENLREEFIATVVTRYLAKHPPDTEDKIHVGMVRLEIEATKI